MRLRKFWQRFSDAAATLDPRLVREPQSVRGDDCLANVTSPDGWLSVRAVDRYDENDFDFLPPAERDELSRDVARYRAVAEVAATGRAPTGDELR